jgi:hypothetical protein
MDKMLSMMFDLYGVCVRQESDCTNHFVVGQFKRFLIGKKPYACSQEKFHHLMRAWRALARELPEALFIEDAASFDDPNEKRIGWRDFLNNLQLPALELSNLFQRLLSCTENQT